MLIIYGENLSFRLRTQGTQIVDSQGNAVSLVGCTVDHNEWYRPEYFDQTDIQRMIAKGGGILEVHATRLGRIMPQRGVFDETYIARINQIADWCETLHIYCIINIEDLSYTSWGSGMPDWMLDGHGYGSAPYSQATVNQACLDFWDIDNPKHDDNRSEFINVWAHLATQFANYQFVHFSIMNEPMSHLTLTSRTQSQHLGDCYSRYMAQIIDAIQAISPESLIFIDKPYLWYTTNLSPDGTNDMKPIDRNGIVWEDHYYANSSASVSDWKTRVNSGINLFSATYGKPFNVGEWGVDDGPPNVNGWQNILTEQVKHLSGRVPIRQWHTWGYLYGEWYGDQYSYFTATESETLLNIVLAYSSSKTSGWIHTDGQLYRWDTDNTVAVLRGCAMGGLGESNLAQWNVGTGSIETEIAKMMQLANNRVNIIRVCTSLVNGWAHPEVFNDAIDQVVASCKKRGISIVLEFHGVTLPNEDPSVTAQRFNEMMANHSLLTNWWLYFAERYKNEPTINAFELYNEPNGDLTSQTQWRGLMDDVHTAIRSAHPNVLIVVAGVPYGVINADYANNPYPDNKTAYGWDEYVINRASYWTQEYASGDFTGGLAKTTQFFNQYEVPFANLPVWKTEFGVTGSEFPNVERWLSDELDLMNSRNSAWLMWWWWGTPGNYNLYEGNALSKAGEVWMSKLAVVTPPKPLNWIPLALIGLGLAFLWGLRGKI